MKISINLLVVAAMLPVAGLALAAPPVDPARGGFDGSGPSFRETPSQQKERQAKIVEAEQLGRDAAADLHAGRYAQAEIKARQSSLLNSGDGVPAEVLAAALEAQGKDKEALQQYQAVVEHYDTQPRNLLPYAQLLLKSGQWAQAVAIYNQALPSLPDGLGPHPESPVVQDGDLMRANSCFSPDVPEPAALATALHLARGLVYNAYCDWSGGAQDTEAMGEYTKALQVAPGNALANYLYGKGWQKLGPADRAKFGTAQQAKAALQKAVKIGNANVRTAAAKALRDAG